MELINSISISCFIRRLLRGAAHAPDTHPLANIQAVQLMLIGSVALCGPFPRFTAAPGNGTQRTCPGHVGRSLGCPPWIGTARYMARRLSRLADGISGPEYENHEKAGGRGRGKVRHGTSFSRDGPRSSRLLHPLQLTIEAEGTLRPRLSRSRPAMGPRIARRQVSTTPDKRPTSPFPSPPVIPLLGPTDTLSWRNIPCWAPESTVEHAADFHHPSGGPFDPLS